MANGVAWFGTCMLWDQTQKRPKMASLYLAWGHRLHAVRRPPHSIIYYPRRIDFGNRLPSRLGHQTRGHQGINLGASGGGGAKRGPVSEPPLPNQFPKVLFGLPVDSWTTSVGLQPTSTDSQPTEYIEEVYTRHRGHVRLRCSFYRPTTYAVTRPTECLNGRRSSLVLRLRAHRASS